MSSAHHHQPPPLESGRSGPSVPQKRSSENDWQDLVAWDDPVDISSLGNLGPLVNVDATCGPLDSDYEWSETPSLSYTEWSDTSPDIILPELFGPDAFSTYPLSTSHESAAEKRPRLSFIPESFPLIPPDISEYDLIYNVPKDVLGGQIHLSEGRTYDSTPLNHVWPVGESFPKQSEVGTEHDLQRDDSTQHSTDQSPTERTTPMTSPSTGSDMTSSSEDVSGDEESESLEQQKAIIITRMLLKSHEIFRANRVTSWGEGNCSSPSDSQSQQHTRDCRGTLGSVKRAKYEKPKGSEENEDRDDDDDKRLSDLKFAEQHNEQMTKRLACPFFKHDSSRFYSSSACYGPGWLTVHRMKEHLYREHSMPIHCPRCCSIFSQESDLAEHSRSSDICQVREALSINGFTKDQEKLLRSKKAMFRAADEEEKWRLVYLILFPDTPLGDLPSPYHDYMDIKRGKSIAKSSNSQPEMSQYDAFLRQELPRKLRKVIAEKIEELTGPIEEILQHQLEGLIRDCQTHVSREYHGYTSHEASSSAQDPTRATEGNTGSLLISENNDFVTNSFNRQTKERNNLPTTLQDTCSAIRQSETPTESRVTQTSSMFGSAMVDYDSLFNNVGGWSAPMPDLTMNVPPTEEIEGFYNSLPWSEMELERQGAVCQNAAPEASEITPSYSLTVPNYGNTAEKGKKRALDDFLLP